jgi:hypothetical protein
MPYLSHLFPFLDAQPAQGYCLVAASLRSVLMVELSCGSQPYGPFPGGMKKALKTW